ncbi:MAG TPA: ATP phosphoribosyltransferase regulatory subunit, partial [Burkholderiaceae bacterium]
RAVLANDAKAQKQQAQLYNLLRAKDMPGLEEITKDFMPETRRALLALPQLYGDLSVVAEARAALPDLPGIATALDELEALGRGLADVTIDLADLRGYEYESGVMFALYVPGLPNAVARGGRYDHVGEAFGRARPATGFSMDLRELSRLLPGATPSSAVRAPWGEDAQLRAAIAHLRGQGVVVIQSLPGHESDLQEFDCDRVLVQEDGNTGNWIIKG